MRNFILADMQDITRAGLTFLLAQQGSGVSSISEAFSKEELISLLRLHSQAVVVLDYTLFNIASVDELLVLHQRFEDVDWLLFSEDLSLPFLQQVLFSSQNFSVVLKDASQDEILLALKQTTAHQRYICQQVANRLQKAAEDQHLREQHKDDVLTKTEQLILKEIALGKTTKEISAEKNVSFHTVNTHRKNIFRKLGVNNAHEAVKYALRAGIVDLVEYYI